MSLKALKLPTEAVTLPDGESFTVRGLSLADITAIVRGRGPEFSLLFDTYRDKTGGDAASLDDANMGDLGQSLIELAPDIASLVIAHASGDGDEEDYRIARRLPFPVQLDAIEKIGKLTFDAEGGPKKVVETVVRVLHGVTGLLTDLRASRAGSLGSAAK